MSGKIARIKGVGLLRLDTGKTDSSQRTVQLPGFAVTALAERRGRPFLGEQQDDLPEHRGRSAGPGQLRQAMAARSVTASACRT